MKTRALIYSILFSAAILTTASAQPAAWTTNAGAQLALSLESPSADVRAQAMQQVIYFAHYNPEVDLTPAVPALVRMYWKDSDERFRMAAAVALHKIGDEDGLQKVRAMLAHQRDRRVQLVSIAALQEYYGADTFAGSREIGRMARELLASK